MFHVEHVAYSDWIFLLRYLVQSVTVRVLYCLIIQINLYETHTYLCIVSAIPTIIRTRHCAQYTDCSGKLYSI